jgi:hypothetical protein
MAESGRPKGYSPEIAEVICDGIIAGLLATVLVWLNRFPESK